VELIAFIDKNMPMIFEYLGSTFILVVLATVLSLAIWVPVGIAISKNQKWEKTIVGTASVIFCIPSLAMFTILITIPALGISRKSALTALVLYAMMPLVKSVHQGIKGVNQSVIEAAKGMGMSARRILFEIELPLASPVIFSGFRVTVVMITGISTIATYIGERNLGRLISQGLQRQNMEMIITGSILISIIAIILDMLLELAGKKIVPKGLRIEKN